MTTDLPELAQYLRFALEELSARDGQYEFEALCRALARARIASNVISGTGPVSAKGDQGRDAETYVSYLRDELGPHSAFLARITDKMAAFCCTLQTDGLKRKFTKDAVKVMGSGAPVERIYCFCSSTVAVGIRHDIEDAVTREAGVPATVLDGKWITEQLSDPELIWIAKRYLELADTMVSESAAPERANDAYAEALERWRMIETPRPLAGDFYEIRAGLRAAKEPGDARPDLPFWLSRMEAMLQSELDEDLRPRVHYELAVATLIGQRDLRPADQHVEAFFAELDELEHPFRLLDAAMLLMFIIGMIGAGRTTITPTQLGDWQEALRSRLAALLTEDPPPTRRAYYRYAFGMLQTHPEAASVSVVDTPRELPEIDEIRQLVAESGVGKDPEALSDPAGAVATWTELLQDLPAGHLFPVERLASVVALMTGALVDQPGWTELTEMLDDALAQSAGRAAAAEQAFDRAKQLEMAGRPLDAIAAFHSAKVDWHSGDTVRETILSLLALAECYTQLRLPAAGVQYALAASYVAFATDREEARDLVGAGLVEAARIEFLAGRWLNAARAAVAAFAAIAEQEVLLAAATPPEELLLAHQIFWTVTAAARDLGATFEGALDPLVPTEDFTGIREEALKTVTPLEPHEWQERAAALELLDLPFADAGPSPGLSFAALGLNWHVTPESSSASDVRAAQRLAAAASVLAAELAHTDLVLLPGAVSVRVAACERRDRDFKPEDLIDAKGRMGDWSVTLGANEEWLNDAEAVSQELSVVLLTILSERSTLSLDRLKTEVDAVRASDSLGKLFVARAYDELHASAFEAMPELQCETPPPWPTADPIEHPSLAWRDGPGPGYSAATAEEHLRNRYPKLLAPIRLTLPRLLATAAVYERILALRERGLLDWQILQAIHGVVTSFRLQEHAADLPRERLQELALAEETPEMAQVPIKRFTAEALDHAANVGMAATADLWGLELRSTRPDFEGLRRLLTERYGYLSDDIEHEDPFVR